MVEAELPDHAQQKASQQIDGERPCRENGTHAILNPTIQSVAGQRSRCAKYQQKYAPHAFPASDPISGPVSCPTAVGKKKLLSALGHAGVISPERDGSRRTPSPFTGMLHRCAGHGKEFVDGETADGS